MNFPMRWFINFILLGIISAFSYVTYAGECIPSPSSKHLLYTLSEQTEKLIDISSVENKLFEYYDSGLQIVLIITDTLCGMDIAMYASTIGEKWGVGRAGKDDGIVIVMVPKTRGRKGKLFVSPGRGIQDVLPDAVVKRHVNAVVRAYFKKERYTGGLLWLIDALAVKVLDKYREYSVQESAKTYDEDAFSILEVLGIVVKLTLLIGVLIGIIATLIYLMLHSTRLFYYIRTKKAIALESNIKVNRYEIIMSYVSIVLTIVALLLFFTSFSYSLGAGLSIPFVAIIVGFVLSFKKQGLLEHVRKLKKRISPFAFPVHITKWTFENIIYDIIYSFTSSVPVSKSSSTWQYDYNTYSNNNSTENESPTYDSYSSGSTYTTGGSSGSSSRTVTFGGGHFNGGGAGAEW